jgi:hypothetical protein
MVGYPYTYGDIRKITSKVELVKESVDFPLARLRTHLIQGAQVDRDL